MNLTRWGVLLSALAVLLALRQSQAACATAQEENTPKEAGWYYQQGKSFEAGGDYQQAAEAFKAAVERSLSEEPAASDPQTLAQWHAQQALLHLDQEEYLLAQSHAQRACDLQPKNRRYHSLYRDAQRGFKKEQQRQEQLAKLTRQAEEAQSAGKPEKALSLWKQARRLDASNPRVLQGIAQMQAFLDARHPRVRKASELSPSPVSPSVAQPSKPLVSDYLVSPGDVIEVFVWQQSDLSRDVLVRPDGKLSFPLVGDINAAGLNLTELDQAITGRLKTYIRFPDVSLAIKRFGGTKTIVLGEVGSPGVYVPTGQGGILQVIAMAGGFTEDAAKKSVMLIRGGLSAPQVAKLNLESVLERGRLEENVTLEPNDIVYVPKADIPNTLDFLARFYDPISQVLVGQSIATNFGADIVRGEAAQ